MCVCVRVCVQIEQVSQLSSLVDSQLQYHRQAVQVLDELSDKLRDRCSTEAKWLPSHLWNVSNGLLLPG